MNTIIPAKEFLKEVNDLRDYHLTLAGWWSQNLPQQSARLFRCPEWDFAQQGAIP